MGCETDRTQRPIDAAEVLLDHAHGPGIAAPCCTGEPHVVAARLLERGECRFREPGRDRREEHLDRHVEVRPRRARTVDERHEARLDLLVRGIEPDVLEQQRRECHHHVQPTSIADRPTGTRPLGRESQPRLR